jgi:hypothetical protein
LLKEHIFKRRQTLSEIMEEKQLCLKTPRKEKNYKKEKFNKEEKNTKKGERPLRVQNGGY